MMQILIEIIPIILLAIFFVLKKKTKAPNACWVPLVVMFLTQPWWRPFSYYVSEHGWFGWRETIYLPLIGVIFAIPPIVVYLIPFSKQLAKKVKFCVIGTLVLSFITTIVCKVAWDDEEFFFFYFLGLLPSVMSLCAVLLPSMVRYVSAEKNGKYTCTQSETVFCRHCGNTIYKQAVICPSCGCDTGYKQEQADVSNSGLNFLAFLFPLIGFIMYLCMKGKYPYKGECIGRWALVSAIINVSLSIIIILGRAM